MTVEIEKNGPVTTVIINRPQVRNAVDAATAILLREAFQAFADDRDSHVAVLCGANGAFCAGYDLKSVADRDTPPDFDPAAPGPMGPSRLLLEKPVIAAVEGHAVAGGLELALWCDMRVAAEDAVFGVFCRRWGVPLIDGGTVRLPRLIGASRALDMILTGRAVSAAEALQFGLANRVVPTGKARAAAEELALQIARFPQACMRADRMSALRQWELDMETALLREAEGGIKPLLEEAKAGATRFRDGAGRSGSFADT